MNTQQSRVEVEHYLAGMRAALADLPAAEVAEIMEDVEAHLAEIAAELDEGETLEQRLGTPDAYAQELRNAAGYPTPARTAVIQQRLSKPRLAAWVLAGATLFTVVVGTVLLRDAEVLLLPAIAIAFSYWLIHDEGPAQRRVMALPEVRKLGELLDQPADSPAGRAIAYLRSLQPAWWLVRAALLVIGALLLTSRDLFAFLLIAVLAGVSFWAGPKSKTDRRWLWITLPASALAVAVLFNMIDTATGVSRYAAGVNGGYPVPVAREYENIYAFDSTTGKLLDGVLLYDQNGNAINAPHYGMRSCSGEPVIPNNLYPRPKIDYVDGQCVTVPPSFSVAPSVSGTPSASPSTSPSASSAPPSSASVSPPPSK